MENRLKVHTFGGLRISRGRQGLDGLSSRKAQALLVYLACTDRPQAREVLAELLWDDRTQSQALGNLRRELTALRQNLGDFLEITRQFAGVNPDEKIWLDAGELEASLRVVQLEGGVHSEQAARQVAHAVMELYQGEFLDGFFVYDSRGFEEWLTRERERLHRLVVDALHELVVYELKCGEFKSGVAHCTRLLELDPLMEAAHREMMNLLAVSGQRGAALAQYETCRELLQRELGVEPSVETRETYELLLKGERPPGVPVVPAERERRMALIGECPYRGLSAFREEDAPFFFGREAFTDQLHATIKSRSFVAVIVGASGSGKSSAVFAGLLPRLREERGWLVADFHPGNDPFEALSLALVSLLEPGLREAGRLVEAGKLAGVLKAGELSLSPIVEQVLHKSDAGERLLLIADQFEELYALCPDPELRRRFLDILLQAVEVANAVRTQPLVLLLTMRADFMGQALAYRPFADALQEASLLMGPMNRKELRDAIEKPAEVQGAAFEVGLVERLLDDVGEEPGNLPLLEFALTLIWEQENYGWLTHAVYEQIGRVEGALANYADQVFEDLELENGVHARRVFVQLVRPGEGTEDTRRVATRAELGEGNWELVGHLADRRLVMTGADEAGSETVQLVHEALIQKWGRFREWMEADRVFRSWQERLRANLRGWEESGEDEGALLRGAPLVEAENWLAERGDELSLDEISYIQAGINLREHRAAVREQRRRRIVYGLVAGFVVAVVLLVLAGLQWQRAEKAGDLAVSRQYAAETAKALEGAQRATATVAQGQALYQAATAQAEAQTRATAQVDAEQQRAEADVQRQEALRQASVGLANAALLELDTGLQDRAVNLALEALEKYPYTFQAEQALGQAVIQSRLRQVLNHEDKVQSVQWSPDGKRLLTASRDGTAKIWDPFSNEELINLDHEGKAFYAHWSVAGDQVLTVDMVKWDIIIWDSQDGERLITLEGHTEMVNCAYWSPDGSRILSGSDDFTARIWDAKTGELLLTLERPGNVQKARWSPSGETFVTMGDDALPVIWDASTGQQIIALEGHTEMIWDGRWSPAGDRLLTSADDSSAKVWDTESGEMLLEIPFVDWKARSRWSPDGQKILARDREYPGPKVLDAVTGEILFYLDHENPNANQQDAIWSPSGDRVAAGYWDGSVVVWDATSGERQFVFRGHSSSVSITSLEDSLHWSPDGRWLASGSRSGEVMIWDTLSPLSIPVEGGVSNARWSPTGDRILKVIRGGAKIYDSINGELKLSVEHDSRLSYGDYWSPMGDKFGLGPKDGELRIYDASNGTILWTIIEPGNAEHAAQPYAVATCTLLSWSPDGQRIATGHEYNGTIWIRDATSGEGLIQLRDEIGDFPATKYFFAEVRWSPLGDKILTADTFEHLIIWDADSGEKLFHIKDFDDDVIFKAAWSPDGTRIATHIRSNIGNIWDAATGEKLLQFSGHTGEVWGLFWSPSGERLATGGFDNTVRVWDTSTGEQVLHYPLDRQVDHVDWSPDGHALLISNDDRLVVLPIWNSRQELINYASECCVVRPLTPEERALFGLPPLEE